MNIKCPDCGLVNFASAAECKRCHVKFHQPEVIPEVANDDRSMSEAQREPGEVEQAEQPESSLAPLSEYFVDEPAPFSDLVKLFAICLGLAVFAAAIQLIAYIAFMTSSTWDSMTEPAFRGYLYTPVIEPLIYLQLILESAALAAAATLLHFLLRKSWSFLKWVRLYLIAGLIYHVEELVAALILRSSLAAEGMEALPPFDLLLQKSFWVLYSISAFVTVAVILIWFAYFGRSERVKKIFIN